MTETITSEQYRQLLSRQPKRVNAKRGKYNNMKTTVDGFTFDSKMEANRYIELKRMQQSGEIKDLQRQVKYPLSVNGKKVCGYIADFVYKNKRGDTVVEDVKGVRTDVYRIKFKLFRAIYGFEIKEV